MDLLVAIRKFFTRSIRFQLMLGIASVHAVMMSIFIVDLVERQRDFLSEQSKEQVLGLAETLAVSSTSWVIARDLVGLDELLQSNVTFPGLQYAMVLTPQDNVLAHTDKSKRGQYASDDISRRLLTSDATPQTLFSDSMLIDVAYPILVEEELIGWARVGISQNKIAQGLFAIKRDGVFYTLVAILIGSLFAYWMANSLTRGLQKLVVVADGIRQGRQDLRANLTRGDEIGHLAKGLNSMLDTLEQRGKALIESEDQLRKITDILPAPVARVDRDGRYIFVSAAYERWFGKRPVDVIGRMQSEIASPELYEKVLPYFQNALAGESATFDIAIKSPSGEALEGLVNALPDYDHEGKVSGFFVVVADITGRKKMEQEAQAMREQIAQASKMEAVGQLTAGIAHDFNNVLGAISGYTELAKQMNTKSGADNVDRYLAEVLKGCGRAQELIAQMMLFSRRSAAVQGGEVSVVLVDPICKEVVSLLRSSMPSSIALHYRAEDESLKARIQSIQLHQILLNLCVNARDAIGEYGKIEILLTKMLVDNRVCTSCKHPVQGSFVMISVRDTGSGIPAAVLDKMFDPFFTTKEVGKGTGMGLSVVHGIVHAVGGHLLVESNTENGSEIHILLPLEESAHTEEKIVEQPEPQQNGSALTGIRIMVVDDEEPIGVMLQEYLSTYGAQVQFYPSSKEALETFERNPDAVDLVITDETMPGMSGMLLAKNMLKCKPSLPIILCTGYSEHATPQSSAAIGIAAFYYKPVKMGELREKVEELIKNRASVQSDINK